MAKIPSTPALRHLRAENIPHTVHTYRWKKGLGARGSAEALGWELAHVVKTLVFETDTGDPFLILMHGHAEVSTKQLARVLGVRSVRPADKPERHTGYQKGGTSPFGTRKPLPVYVERSILALESLLINGGARGVLVEVTPAALQDATPVDVARLA